jgi:probable HAF family extracellular repeat protein
VVGIANDLEVGLARGWYRSPRGRLTYLRTPEGIIGSYAARVNNAGVIAGFVVHADETLAAARWSSPTAAPTVLPGTVARGQGIAFGLNDGGTVVGGVADASREFVPASWPRRRGPVTLRVHGVENPGVARDVNAAGQVAGVGRATAEGVEQAVRWDAGGRARLLGTLPGGTASAAYAVSARGRVTGEARDADGVPHAFVWTGTGRLRPLPALVGGGESGGNALDDTGTVAGRSTAADGTVRAVLWRCAFGR